MAMFMFLFDINISHAITFSEMTTNFTDKIKAIFLYDSEEESEDQSTSQNIPLFKAVVFDEQNSNVNDFNNSSSNESLSATSGSLRVSTEDIDFSIDSTISVYEVKKGDTLSTVAKLFNVSKNTIIWANDLKSQNIKPGDMLVILPMTGIKHIVKKGDSVSSIAKKYKADIDDISKFNGISKDSELAIGSVVLVPEGEISVASTGKISPTSKLLSSYTNYAPDGFLIRPLVGGYKSQGLHGRNGIDIAAPQGTPLLASGDGLVIVAKTGGYNGGYGNFVIISHANNIQTVYAHMRSVYVVVGQTVKQGQIIGSVGNTGRSTGPHIHFEIRGAKNPF